MDPLTYIPDYQPVPFPAPLWLLQLLLVLGFFLHVIPMNVSLGGTFMSGLYLLKGKSGPHAEYYQRAGRLLSAGLPLYVSFAVTQGIVPLLFIQLMYGPLYYASSIMMAIPWLSVLGLLVVGYYGVYWFKHVDSQGKPWAPWVIMGVFLLFLSIGFIFTNNMTLMTTPERWTDPSLFPVAGSSSGWALNLGEPQLIPRYLHFVLAAFAVTGVAVGAYGLYWLKRDQPFGEWLIRQGAGTYLVITLIQLFVGFWFLYAIPRPIMKNFMGGEEWGTISFGVGMLFSVISIIAMALAWKDAKAKPYWVGMISAVLTVLAMVVMRHVLRLYFIGDHLDPSTVPVKIQWDLLIAFVITAVGLIGYLIWLTKVAWKAFNPPSSSASS